MLTGKSICLGNQNTLICLDRFGQLYDAYYPYVGLENHCMGDYVHKIGVWADDQFSWLDDGKWQIEIDYKPKTMISKIRAVNHELQIRLDFEDGIYNEDDIFIRHIQITNLSDRPRLTKVFLNQQFELYESFRGDTAIYDHDIQAVIHYKGDRAILINAVNDQGQHFDDYTIGLFGIEGKEGAYKDAENGVLSKNNVEHGRVDSVIGQSFNLEPRQTKEMFYWMIFEAGLEEAKAKNDFVLKRTAKDLLISTENYWKAWLNKQDFDFTKIESKYLDLFYKSLLLIETHSGKNGVIIASGDSDLLKMGRGTYSYMWPRDGALVILPLIQAGYYHTPKNFFQFCENVITKEGYMLHKYRADQTLGSSWHPWVQKGKSELPIQEDETALVLYALGKYYEKTKYLEFIEKVYDSLIRKPAEFMCEYLDEKYNLPKPTFDLWEEKFGISTFTVSTVIAALRTASNFAKILGKIEDSKRYLETSEKFKQGLLEHLWDEEIGCFIKQVNIKEDGLEYDRIVDMSSVHSLIEFEILDIEDEKITRSIKAVEEKIQISTEIGGICRYEDDYYFRVTYDQPGNPWIITSLWLARYYLRKAKSEEGLKEVYKWLDWVLKYAQKSGVLSEQINPLNGQQMSATPLTWSQAEYAKTILDLDEKLKGINGIKPKGCN